MIRELTTLFVYHVCFIGPAFAHDWDADGGRDGDPPTVTQSEDLELNDVLQGIVDAAKVWDTAYPLTVCFIDRDPEKAEFVAVVAREWQESASGLDIDVGSVGQLRYCDDETADIRISYAHAGNWAYVGTDASKVGVSLPTLNLNALNGALTPRIKSRSIATIRHEFDHALAMQHEHQNPESTCSEELDWETVYAALGGPPNNWDRQKVDLNMRPLLEGQTSNGYDPNSSQSGPL